MDLSNLWVGSVWVSGFVGRPAYMNTPNIIFITSLYVDDLLVIGSNLALVEEFRQEMKDVFEMIDLDLTTYFLCMEITQKKNGVFIWQKKYAKEI